MQPCDNGALRPNVDERASVVLSNTPGTFDNYLQ